MSSLPHANILVVEDEALIAMDLQILLENAGYRVLGPANSPSAALALLDGEKPDLALLDINLGGRDIFEIADAVGRNMPVIFLTGHSIQRLPEAHRHRTLVEKPYRPHALLEIVRQALLARAGAV